MTPHQQSPWQAKGVALISIDEVTRLGEGRLFVLSDPQQNTTFNTVLALSPSLQLCAPFDREQIKSNQTFIKANRLSAYAKHQA